MYHRVLFPVLDLAQQLRRDNVAQAATGQAPPNLSDTVTVARLRAAQTQLAAQEQRLGAQLGTNQAYAAMQSAYAVAESSQGLEAVFVAHTAHIDAVLALLAAATDGSNLTLDPDIDSYYLMDGAFFRIPDIVETSGKLRGLGLAIMAAGSATPQQRQLVSEAIPIAEF